MKIEDVKIFIECPHCKEMFQLYKNNFDVTFNYEAEEVECIDINKSCPSCLSLIEVEIEL